MRNRKSDTYQCPSCGAPLSPMDRLYQYQDIWMCETDIRDVIGLKQPPTGAEFTLEEICDALKIPDRPAASLIEELAHRFHGEALDD